LNAQYEAEMRKIVSKAPPEKREMSASEKQEDYYKGFRSSVVIFWLVCNFGLCAVVLSTAGLERVDTTDTTTNTSVVSKKSTIYLAVVLWSVAGLSAFKFLGAMWFLIVRMFRGV
jgi:chitin synthase